MAPLGFPAHQGKICFQYYVVQLVEIFLNVFNLSDIVDIMVWFVPELYRILSPSLETKNCNSNSCAKVTASKLTKI